jgi:2-phospho-L-lactate guanylyltransferase
VTGTWAVVPVNAFHRAKSRLAEVLDPAARIALARATCVHVLGVLRASPGLAGTLVLTPDEAVAACARRLGAEVLEDPVGERRLAHLVDPALEELAARQAQAALELLADLPALRVEDVGTLLAALRQAAVVVAPDRHERGTNALALRPPAAMRSCFGHEDSLARHVAAAAAHGLSVEVVRSPSLALDVDRAEDLALWAAWPRESDAALNG